MRIPIRAMAVRATWIRGPLRCARMATTPLTPTDAHPTATMDLAGSRAESLLASGLGAGVDAASMGDVALADGATTEAGRPFPGAEDFAVGSVTVTPVEVDVASVVADMPSTEVDVASVAADMPSTEVDVASVGVDMPSTAVDVAPVVVDMPSVAVDVAPVVADMPSVAVDVAPVVAEAEGVMVVVAGRFRHNS